MIDKLQKFIKEKIVELPETTQEAINAVDWINITEEIGKKYLLSETETSYLQVETMLILTGLEDADGYARNIENQVETSKNKAENIVDEVYEKIFNPIEDILEENIKKNLKNKNITAAQNLDFILSGGDYSVFVAPTTQDSPQLDSFHEKYKGNESKISGYTTDTPPKMMDMKNKFLYDNDKNQ